MTAPQVARSAEPLQRLKLFKGGERLDALLHAASAPEVTSAAVLDRLRSEDVAAKVETQGARRTVMARLP